MSNYKEVEKIYAKKRQWAAAAGEHVKRNMAQLRDEMMVARIDQGLPSFVTAWQLQVLQEEDCPQNLRGWMMGKMEEELMEKAKKEGLELKKKQSTVKVEWAFGVLMLGQSAFEVKIAPDLEMSSESEPKLAQQVCASWIVAELLRELALREEQPKEEQIEFPCPFNPKFAHHLKAEVQKELERKQFPEKTRCEFIITGNGSVVVKFFF